MTFRIARFLLLAASAACVRAEQTAAPAKATTALAPTATATNAASTNKATVGVARKGIGVPGEVTLGTPALDATWQSYRGKLLLFSLIDKREDAPLLISQDVFTLTLDNGRIIRSSQMTASPASVTVVKPDAKAGSHAAGRQATVTLTDPDTQLKVTWKAIQRDGSDYLRQELVIEAGQKPVVVTDVRLIDLYKEGFKTAPAVAGIAPIVSDTLFLAVEDADAKNSVVGSTVKGGIGRKLALQPTGRVTVSSVIGACQVGQFEPAFKAYREREAAVADPTKAAAKADKPATKTDKPAAKVSQPVKGEAKPAAPVAKPGPATKIDPNAPAPLR